MKLILQIILILSALPCFAQPTGHQKIFLEITDDGDTLDFKSCFKGNDFDRKVILESNNYQLLDISDNQTGFENYSSSEFIHKTLMTDDHQIVIVKDRIDTMRIEILNAFNVYFMSIPFRKGNFRFYVNDGKEDNWLINTLPFKQLTNEQNVYDITPIDWKVFRVKSIKPKYEYFISEQFEKQHLLAKPVMPEDDPNFKNPRRVNNLRVEVADYNFDGKNDYREHKWHNTKQWNYFIYSDSIKGFVLDTQLSNLAITHFDFDKKNFMVKKPKKSQDGIDQTDIYQFVDGKPTLFQEKPLIVGSTEGRLQSDLAETASTIKTYQAQRFKFVLEKNTPGIDIPPINGFYANKVTVFGSQSDQLIYSLVAVGNKVKEAEGCSDSLQIADYNFDGFPDFRICNNSVAGKHTYYIYHQKKNTFIIEKTLSELLVPEFNFKQKIAKGTSEKKEYLEYTSDIAKRYYTEQLQFEGDALENLTITTSIYPSGTATTEKCKYINQKRIYEGDSIGLKLLHKKPLIKNVGEFKFEMVFNPEEYKTSGEKGSYVKILTIYKKEGKCGPYEIHGNYLREVPHWLDSLEIADFNFDGYPDIRVYNSQINNGSYSYMIYNPTKEVDAYYAESLFSLSQDAEFIPNKKIMKGTILEGTQTLYFFLKNDTLTLTKQDKDLSKPPFIEESIYRNGNRQSLRAAYGSLEPELKKEYGDYNFDGYEDLRRQSKRSPYQWDVFIYHPQRETFVKDTLLSRFEFFNYNKNERKFDGYYRVKSDDLTTETNYYQWSFAENKMILYQTMVCVSKFPGSESSRCTISKLVDGKWIEIETFGAE